MRVRDELVGRWGPLAAGILLGGIAGTILCLLLAISYGWRVIEPIAAAILLGVALSETFHAASHFPDRFHSLTGKERVRVIATVYEGEPIADPDPRGAVRDYAAVISDRVTRLAAADRTAAVFVPPIVGAAALMAGGVYAVGQDHLRESIDFWVVLACTVTFAWLHTPTKVRRHWRELIGRAEAASGFASS